MICIQDVWNHIVILVWLFDMCLCFVIRIWFCVCCYLSCFVCVCILYYCDLFHIWLSFDRFWICEMYVCNGVELLDSVVFVFVLLIVFSKQIWLVWQIKLEFYCSFAATHKEHSAGCTVKTWRTAAYVAELVWWAVWRYNESDWQDAIRWLSDPFRRWVSTPYLWVEFDKHNTECCLKENAE
jgi:hypothetical protein